jgi:tape measure domain-containing protein
MAAVTTELKVLVKAVGKGELKELEASLNKLAVTAKTKVDTNFKLVSSRLKEIQSTSTTSIKNLRDYRNAWRDIAAQLDISSKEFKEATAEAAKLDAQLAKAEKRRPAGRGGRLASAAKGVGAIAGAGVFGGPEGAIGATIGLAGGVPGAIVGGAIGAQVGQFRKAVGATAEYAASIAKLRIALKGVTTSQADYNNALNFVQESTKRFAIPQEIVTRQFTKLQASVQGAGGNLEDTKTAFNGVVAAVRATGGSLQDINSALTATAQVFSKGKVSAEELRQQIGERLPGAFTLFAKSLGKTPQELDKALEKGEVSLQDFQRFAESIFRKYGVTAEIIASSPEAAGDRLAVALSNMNESVGRLLQPIGAAFQTVFTAILKQITDAANALDRFLGISDDARIAVLNKQVTASNLKLAAVNANIQRAQQGSPEADLLGGSAAQGGGISALLTERQRIERTRDLASTELKSITAMQKLRGEIEQSKPGKGLPGITPTLNGNGGGATAKAPMGQAEFELQKRILEFQEQGLVYRKAIAEFDLKSLLVKKQYVDDPLKADVELNKARVRLNEQVLKIDEQRVKEAEKLDEAKVDALKAAFKEAQEIDKLIPKTTELEKLWESVGDTIASSVGGALEDVLFNAKSLQESLSGILKSLASMFLQFGVKSLVSMIPGFADGGIMSQSGPLDLKRYARGGVANSPQLAMFGEGSTPEAYVPLPDGRSIPVTMRGAGSGVQVGAINITVENTGDDLTPAAQKQLAGQVKGIVLSTLANERRSGGML